MLYGLDISSYQAGIDLTAVDGDVVIIKATEGRGYRNPAMAAQIASARKGGKLVGLYHFVSVGNTVEVEVANYLDAVKPYTDFVPVLDYEPADRSRVAFAAAWLDQVQAALKVRPWIYADASTASRTDWGKVRDTTPLWVARYPSSATVGYQPGAYVHPDWARTVGWQYTSAGSIPGWAGRLDLNVFYLTREEMRAMQVGALIPPPVTPPVTPAPLTVLDEAALRRIVREEVTALIPTLAAATRDAIIRKA